MSAQVKPGDLVWILFDDVQHQTKGWTQQDAWPRRGDFVAVGVLLKQTKRSTYIANVFDGPYVFCSYTIPTGCIRKIKRLRRAK